MDQTGDKSILGLVDEAIRAALLGTHTALPGRIESYDAATQTATVAIELQQEFEGDDEGVSIPLLLDVPVLFPRAGGFSITFPVAADDKCLVLFAERDISGWLQQGDEALPPTARKHAFSDAIALLGLWPSTNPIVPAPSATALQIRSDDGTIGIDISATGIRIDSAESFIVQADGADGVTIDTSDGPFLVTSSKRINFTRGSDELLAVISAALAAIAAITTHAGTVTLDPAAITAINAQKDRIDAIRA